MFSFPQALVNPELKVTDYTKLMLPEGCASIKGYSAVVPRWAGVTVKGRGWTGEQVEGMIT